MVTSLPGFFYSESTVGGFRLLFLNMFFILREKRKFYILLNASGNTLVFIIFIISTNFWFLQISRRNEGVGL